MSEYNEPMTVAITVTSMAQLTAVYALLGGASFGAIAAANQASPNAKSIDAATPATGAPSAQFINGAAGEQSSISSTATTGASLSDVGEIDAAGHPWSEAMHASTKNKTKEGLWRMKVGVSRPEPLPGYPKDTGTGLTTEAAPAGNSATAPAVDEDDEFAAFTTALGKDAAPAAAPVARTWSDADLGALCNQAAVKLGDPAPVKELIAAYVPADATPHSRNIPADKRDDFAKAVEAKAGVVFAG